MNKVAASGLSVACLWISLVLAGCGSESASVTPALEQPISKSAPMDLPLELDNGKKWQVDEHTRVSAAGMTQYIREAAPIASVEDARTLGSGIEEQLKGLIQGCTMTGPSHDQLHVFLAALFPRVAKLKKEADLELLRTTQQEIGSLFDAYQDHFE